MNARHEIDSLLACSRVLQGRVDLHARARLRMRNAARGAAAALDPLGCHCRGDEHEPGCHGAVREGAM